MSATTRSTSRTLLAMAVLTLAAGACDKSATDPTEEAAAETPAVVEVPSASHGAYDENLYKVTCLATPGPKIEISSTCPVVRWDGYDYWALSYGDNRSSFAIHAYDDKGQLQGVVEATGARYVYAIDVDDAARTVTFRGQADHTVTMTWEELQALR